MNLPISLQEIEELCEKYNATILDQSKYGVRIKVKSHIIDVWFITGKFLNYRTNHTGKGRKSLINYVNSLRNLSKNNSKPLK